MELTSKQRAQLRGVANTIDTIVHIGKDGISSNIVKQANDGQGDHQVQGPGELPAYSPGGLRADGPAHPQRGGAGDWDQVCPLPPALRQKQAEN